MKKSLVVTMVVFGGLILSGCPSTKGSYSGNVADDAAASSGSAGAEVEEATGSVDPGFSSNPSAIDDERQANSLLQERVLYFDYDKSIVGDDFIPVLQAHSDFLINNPDKGVVLSGHADSRGSNEYNLALGQRRADAVRDLMRSMGVTDLQLESLSFGEESPAALGETENAWQMNRRVEIRYTDE